MWTRDAARVLQWKGIGSIEVGNHADIIVVDRDLMTCDVEAIGKTKTLLTLVAAVRFTIPASFSRIAAMLISDILWQQAAMRKKKPPSSVAIAALHMAQWRNGRLGYPMR